jgi:transcriptional regulator with XRE-family HTH domain
MEDLLDGLLEVDERPAMMTAVLTAQENSPGQTQMLRRAVVTTETPVPSLRLAAGTSRRSRFATRCRAATTGGMRLGDCGQGEGSGSENHTVLPGIGLPANRDRVQRHPHSDASASTMPSPLPCVFNRPPHRGACAPGWKIERIASDLGWSRAKLDRIESGTTTPKEFDLRAALELYGADSDQRARLIELRREARKRGWWTSYGDVFSGSYVAWEHEAARIRDWQPQVIPGLLQTEDYARAVIKGARPADSPESIERRVQARMARRTLLGRHDAPRLHAIIDESALLRQVGGGGVLRQQLRFLIDCTQRPNVATQILPLSTGAHPGVDGAFIILSYDDQFVPDIPYSEGPFGDLYPESATEVARITKAWEHLASKALSLEASTELLMELAGRE